MKTDKRLLVIPVMNERGSIISVLNDVRFSYSGDILFVDDGSDDGSASILREISGGPLKVLTHSGNSGYGQSLVDGFSFAIKGGYEMLLTMDCDGQHDPAFIVPFFEALQGWDVVSGSRYLGGFSCDQAAPPERRMINRKITALINEITDFQLTDAFCGFKAYRTEALGRMALDEPGYAMPLQFWIQAFRLGLKVREMPVPRLYPRERPFSRELADQEARLEYYRQVINREQARWIDRS